MVCSRKGLDNNCPKTCRDPRTRTCGNGCGALMAQQLPGRKHASCWAVGQWGDGRKVSLSLVDPSDPTQGVVYTMLQGDSKGCPPGVSRTLSIAIRCPGVGMPAAPVLNVSSLGNCAYAALMAHPAACPVTEDSLSRRDQHLAYMRNTAGAGQGSTAQTFANLFSVAAGALGFYFAVGAAWRYSVLGFRGVDALPHLSFWRDLPNAAARAMQGGAEELRGLLEGASSGVPEEARDEPRLPLLPGRRY